MQKELKALLSIINEKVLLAPKENGEQLDIKEQERLFIIAKKHDFAHLLDPVQEKSEEGEKLNKAIKRERSLAVFRFTQQSLELESVKRILEYNKIDFIPLKGALIRETYPEQWMRTSCDIDILVSEKDLPLAEKVLVLAGYTVSEKSNHEITFLSQSNVAIELHFSLIENDFRDSSVLNTALINSKKVDGKIHERKMEDKLFVFYHVYHMAKHFMNGGCGIKPFLDLRLIEKKIGYNEKEVLHLLSESGLTAFYSAVKALNEVWFDGKEHTELTHNMETFVISGGVYGDFKQRSAIKQVKDGGKAKHILKRLFVSYSELCLTFPSLKKCPLLFPLYQVVRWFRLVFGKDRERIKKTIAVNNSVSTEQKDGIKELAEQLNLL